MGHASVQTTEQLYGHLVPGYHDSLRVHMDGVTENIDIILKPRLRAVNI